MDAGLIVCLNKYLGSSLVVVVLPVAWDSVNELIGFVECSRGTIWLPSCHAALDGRDGNYRVLLLWTRAHRADRYHKMPFYSWLLRIYTALAIWWM